MSRDAVIAGLVMVFCCTVVLAQDGGGVPPRAGAAARALDLARAAQRANTELAGSPVQDEERMAQADTESTGDISDEAAADSADQSEDEPKPDATRSRPEKEHRGGRGFLRNAAETVGIALVTAVIVIAVFAASVD